MPIQFEAHRKSDDLYLVTIPAHANKEVATIARTNAGKWHVNVYPVTFWVEANAKAEFPPFDTPEEAIDALAKWGNDVVRVIV